MKCNGQVFSGEFIFAYMLFLITLVLALYLWNTNVSEMVMVENQKDANAIAVDAVEKLVRTRGSPLEWNRADVHSFGIVNESRRLMEDKVTEFVFALNYTRTDGLCNPAGTTNYECRKYILTGGYDVYFNMTYLNGSTASINNLSLFGGRYPVNETNLRHMERTTILGEDIIVLNMEVWK